MDDLLKTILILSKKLISIPSVSGDVDNLEKTLEVAKEELKGYKFEEFNNNKIPSLLFFNSQTKPKKFKLILNAHLDVVPAKKEQFNPVEKEGKLFGRGACDMKAAAATMIILFKDFARKVNYPLGLQIVCDEEVGGFNCTKHQISNGIRADFVIAGESTNLNINNQAKGVIWAKIRTSGKAAHGAYLWNGKNALTQMGQVITELANRFPVPKKEAWKTTVNLATIEMTNKTFNKVPDNCALCLDIRYIPEDKTLIKKQLAKNVGKKGKIEYVLTEPCQFTEGTNFYIKKLQESIKKIIRKKTQTIVKHGAADIRHYNQAGCDGICFGPVGEGLHSDNEWVNIKGLEDYYRILEDFIFQFK